LAGITVALAFLVFSGSAFASAPPSIDSESASDVTVHDATLEAKINPHGAYTGYEFQIDTSSSYNYTKPNCPLGSCDSISVGEPLPAGLVEPSPEAIPAGSGDQSVSLDLASIGAALQPATTYHYRVIASNGGSPTVEGPDQTFTTLTADTAPSIEGESVSHLTPSDATLQAQINTEGLETSYEFYLQEAPLCLDFGCEVPEREPFALPAGKLLGSFVGQSVSVDLNSAGVTLLPGADYRYWVTATSAAGPTRGQTQRFIAPEDGVQPLTTATSPPSGAGQSVGPSSGDQPVGAGGPSASAPGTALLVSPLGKRIKPKVLTKTQKLANALKACEKKSKSMRPACEKQAKKTYGPTSSKAKKR
jgi:hypothetical protein